MAIDNMHACIFENKILTFVNLIVYQKLYPTQPGTIWYRW